MGSETTISIKLPTIDFRNLKQGTSQWETVRNQVWEASKEYGCFEAIFDQIPEHLQKSTFDGLKQLFDVSEETRMQTRSDKAYDGYVKPAAAPLYEAMSIQDVLTPGKVETFVNLMWPQGNSPVSKSIESYSEILSELDKMVRRMVLESLKLDKYIDEHLEKTNCYVGISKYRGPGGEDPKVGMPSHVDDNYCTILSENGVRGLQVFTKDGKEWIPADMSPNSFIVLMGRSLHAFTNGRSHCPDHRVMMSGDEDRYSFGLFMAAKRGHMVKAPEEMVDEDHPLLFKPFDFFEYLDFCFSGARERSSISLKAYCGA